MKRSLPFLAIAAASLIASGCTGGSPANAIPAVQNAVSAPVAAPAFVADKRGGQCDHHTCQPVVLAPLAFDGTNFTIDSSAPCGAHGLGNATPYVAPASGPLAIAANIVVTPTCVPSPMPSTPPRLYVVAIQVKGHDARPRQIKPNFGDVNIYPIAGPVNMGDASWSFAPTTPGLTMQAGASYVFFIAGLAQLPAPPPGPGRIDKVITALAFDGTAFTVSTKKPCGHGGLGAAPGYVAPASGPLVLAGNVSLAQVCMPHHVPSDQLYVVAVLDSHGQHGMKPADGHWSSIPIAGPANFGDNPWIFAPISPGLTMQAGVTYDFFVATMRPGKPSPEPSTSPSSSPEPSESPSASPSDSPHP